MSAPAEEGQRQHARREGSGRAWLGNLKGIFGQGILGGRLARITRGGKLPTEQRHHRQYERPPPHDRNLPG
jgi:hypothetical protein